MTALRDYAASTTQPVLGSGGGPFDEVVEADGSLRPAWRDLSPGAASLTEVELRRAAHLVDRALADDGVTHRRPGEPDARWSLDPLPLVVTAAEWAPLASGLAQRAELLDALLTDLYAERRVLREGLVPPSVVLDHDGFVRSLSRGSADPERLLLTATDLARTTSGQWQVVADRTQAPSGLGYALENRHVVTRALPRLRRDAPLHRVRPFVQVLRAALVEAAPEGVQDPRVVVLTPGPASETAYDQARLAAALGFPLVQGRDLVVRSGTLWTRVHERLERVDVVLRRVDAEWSDPLEMRGESHLGVAGLAEAVRRGRVRVVNGLGSGVLENPGLLPFLPQVCEALLGESLRLAGTPVQWLGDPDVLRRVRADLPSLSVRSIDRRTPLDDLGPDALLAAVDAAPHRFVVHEPITWSQAPRVRAGTLAPGPVSWRAFTVRHGGSFRPMLGGLGSVLEADRSVASKDVWVLKERPDEPDQGVGEVVTAAGSSTATTFVPRVLADFFAFGRLAVRAEDGVRLVLVLHALGEDHADRPDGAAAAALRVVEMALGPDGTHRDLADMLLEPARAGSPAQALAALRTVAESVRDQLSADVWRAFAVTGRAAALLGTEPGDVGTVAEQQLTGLLALQGTVAGMVRDEGWSSLEAGRSVERALEVCRLLRRTVVDLRPIDVDRHVHDAVLTATESAVTHRRRHRGRVRLTGLLELLLADRANPRSLVANLVALREALAALPSSSGGSRPERLLEDLLGSVEGTAVEELTTVSDERRPDLAAHLDDVTERLHRVAEAVTALHLSGAPAPRTFDLTGRGTA